MKSADYSSKIAYRILTHIIYIFAEIMEVTFAESYRANHKGLLHYLGLSLLIHREVLRFRLVLLPLISDNNKQNILTK